MLDEKRVAGMAKCTLFAPCSHSFECVGALFVSMGVNVVPGRGWKREWGGGCGGCGRELEEEGANGCCSETAVLR